MRAAAVLGQQVQGSSDVSGKLRLTRRGRIVLGAFLTVLAAGALALFASLAAPEAMASGEGPNGEQFEYVVVQPGSSLWSLASDLDPTADPRDLITEIVQLNQLEDSSVQAGEAIAVPLRYSDNPLVVSGDEVGA
ncbi:hypothetical protein PQI23_07175 [Leucobacter sp. USCH14]|uniref:hypothetical protein n=1 Tax=Leucobacter sp. USCH14 TaxID=3024838 RepID=UPI0030A075EA